MGIFSFLTDNKRKETETETEIDTLHRDRCVIEIQNNNKDIDALIELLKKRILDHYPFMVSKTYEFVSELERYKISASYIATNYTNEGITSLMNLSRAKLDAAQKRFDEIFINADELNKNQTVFKTFAEKPSMFFVRESICFPNAKHYYFAYETQSSVRDNESMEIKALVTSDESKIAYVETFYSTEDVLRPMTFEEFEKYFLMERIECQDFTSEKDVVEYSNYLRNLFNTTYRE